MKYAMLIYLKPGSTQALSEDETASHARGRCCRLTPSLRPTAPAC